MRSLQTVSICDLLPSSLTGDPFVAAFAEAFDYEFHLLVADTARLLLFANLAEQPNEVLDYLAWQLNVDFYDQTMSLAVKRELISKALYWHSIKGTPAAVERVVQIVFGAGAVEEWFEYDGDPYHFRVRTPGGAFPTSAKIDLIMRMISVVKRASAVLEKLIIEQSVDHPLFFAGVLQVGQRFTVRCE